MFKNSKGQELGNISVKSINWELLKNELDLYKISYIRNTSLFLKSVLTNVIKKIKNRFIAEKNRFFKIENQKKGRGN